MSEQLASSGAIQGLQRGISPALSDIQRKLRLIDSLNYDYKDKEKVFGFLEENPDILDVLIEASSVIRRHFTNSCLTLKVHWDAQTSEEDYLILTISTTLKAEDAVKELDKFDEEWWLDNMHRTDDKLSIDLVYK